MGLPHKLAAQPEAWRGDPLWVPLQCWTDPTKSTPVHLDEIAPTWEAKFGPTIETATTAFDSIDTTELHLGRLVAKLLPATTIDLAQPLYWFKLVAVGGTITPLTVFIGNFTVEG